MRQTPKPLRIMLVGFISTVVLVSWLLWNMYTALQTTQARLAESTQLSRLEGQLIYLDELLTMSARQAATTGDLAWVERYNEFVPQLDTAIQQAIAVVPPQVAEQFQRQTDAANQTLVALETQALAAVEAGNPGAAQALLDSPDYQQNKLQYAAGNDVLLDYLATQLTTTQAANRDLLQRSLLITVLGALALMLIWGLLVRYIRQTLDVQSDLIATQERELTLERTRYEQAQLLTEKTVELEQALQAGVQREHNLQETLTQLQTTQQVVRQLSAPIMPVLKGVLVAPLVGEVDPARAELFIENVLKAAEQYHPHTFIFDLTGLTTVDSHIARVLLDTSSALYLIGTATLLVGTRPEVAQTLVHVGIDAASFQTSASLQEAINMLRDTPHRARLLGLKPQSSPV